MCGRVWLLSVLLGVFPAIQSAFAATFTVNDVGNAADATPGNGVCATAGAVCTLRAAIQEANALAGTDDIHFNIGGGGPQTIVLGSALPTITSVVRIDGTTQPGFVATPPFAPIIQLNAALCGTAALDLRGGSSGSTVRGLVINRCPGPGIRILGSSGNVVAGNFLGTNLAGTAVGPGNQVGVFVGGSAVSTDGNRVGGVVAADRNVISGNTVDGVQIFGGSGGAANNLVQGNYIGVDVNGTASVPNTNQGVAVFTTSTCTDTVVGGTVAGARNVISGNGNDGILIANAGTTGTLVQGNRIGTNAAGTASIPNLRGIEISGGASGSIIGGPLGSQNIISGNSSHGILITASNNNTVSRAIIGLNAAGNAEIANGQQGVELSAGASGNTIGGISGTGNVISGNTFSGVNVIGAGTSGNSILGNLIGLDLAGGAILSNGQFGVAIAQGATGNVIGDPTGGNVISGNDQAGVRIVDNGTNSNLVQSNLIGLDVTGALARPNLAEGVILDTAGVATGNRIGGVGFRNVISGNGSVGIRIRNGMTGTLVIDNIIGRNAADTAGVPNGAGGVRIESSSGNTIGGTGANDGNIISGNSGNDGVAVVGASTGNAILRNSIYANAGLGIDLNDDGVTLNDVGDADTGPNNRQNFPVLSAVTTDGAGNVHIAGSLNAVPGVASYRVEFFAHGSPDPSGFGEARRYLGSANVTTDAAGYALIAVTLPSVVSAPADYVTATATDPANNTSEFCSNVTAVPDLVVTTTADIADGNTASIAALIANNGLDGRVSLREAILATNATAGANTIRFGIPLTDTGHFYYRDDSIPGSLSTVAAAALADADVTDFDPDYPAGFARSWYRIRPSPALTDILDPLVVDAETQPGFLVGAPVVELDGSAGGGATGLSLMTGPSTVKGFVINRFSNEGLALRGAVSGYTITGNYLGTNVSGTVGAGNGGSGIFIGEIGGAPSTIGGDTAAERNIISANGVRGLYLWAWGAPGISSQIRIQGNYVGTDVTGTVGLGVQVRGMTLEFTGGHVIGGSNPGEGNLISGNAGFGVELNGDTGGFGTGADNNVIEGNRIGTNDTGTAAVPNASESIIMFGTIAGASASNNSIRANVIAASAGSGHGILVIGNADSNLFDGNSIGTDLGGTLDLGNTGNGILIQASGGFLPTGNTVRNNVIRFNDLDGVQILGTGAVATLSQNAIGDNGDLGIDLNGDGITANDGGDVDSGPNDLLNFPFATAAVESGGNLTAYFKLDVPAGSYRVEFFKNPSGADPSGNGEGQIFASAVNVTHLGGGSQNFNHTFAGAVGDVITATTTFCTDGAACTAYGSSSEFSNAITAVTTAVELLSFEVAARDAAVALTWRTGSELDNLGFHLYRALDASGPYQRITDTVIPGLGSSPMGATYQRTDSGLTNGVRYFYQLEDIETTGRTTLHGPVSAVPEDRGDELARSTYGDPADVSFRVLERTPRGALIELVTGGFFATPEPDGSVRLEVPGFDVLGSAGSPALPVKRTWLEVVAGRRVSIAEVRGFEETSLAGLRPASAGTPSIVALPGGTVRAVSRRGAPVARSAGVVPASAAGLVETGFQGDVKRALVELRPLRWDEGGQQLLWTRRLQVRVSFAGIEPAERALSASRGRRHREEKSHRERTVLARLSTSKAGLYRVALADVVGPRRRRNAPESLRLSHRGEGHPFHVESSALYFLGDAESVYELELAPGGRRMPVMDGSPSGPPLSSAHRRVESEEDRYYQAALLDAPSLWLWDVVVSPGSKRYPFTISAMLPEEAKLEVFLQGASDFEGPDHQVRISVNGLPVGDVLWDGKAAKTFEASLAPGVLREDGNELSIENVGNPGVAYSMVFLDRFAVTYRRHAVAEAGILEGTFAESGAVAAEGLSPGILVVQTSPETAWLRGARGASFRVEAGRSYLAVSGESVLEATLRRPRPSGLRAPGNRADYLLIGPREFLPAAEPLLRHRRGQGLVARAVAIEDVTDEFGFGEAEPEALKAFVEYAYHHWIGAPRYVVLFGDATYDRKDSLQTGVLDRVPALMRKTSYLWTASDPSYAAVNGEDPLPDLAIGRLPAANVDEARVLVEKVLEYELSGQTLSGRMVLVADDPDAAGDFEADSDEIAAGLSGHEVEKIYLRERGAVETRRAILESFDRGASLLSYVGHGGIALWASENVFEGKDASRLSPQASQPIVTTMNCLNGYFHFPYFDALGEALVKARGKGAIAAFSPSGLSLEAPAHLYHQALVAELTSGRHARLGDAVLAAQRTYAESGLFPELLAIYNLLGDPALRLR